MRRLWWTGLPVALFLVSCGQVPRLSWPASVASIDASTDARAAIVDTIEKFNSHLGSTELAMTAGTGSPITIKIVDSFTSVPSGSGSHVDYAYISQPATRGSARAVTGSTRIAGRAMLQVGKCSIELGSFLFTSTASKDLAYAVTQHEIGHCAGLLHTPDSNQVMSPITVPTYSQEEWKRHFAAVLSAIRG